MSNEAGKGDKQRPTDHKAFSYNYDLIFKKLPKPEITETTCERCGKKLLVNTGDVYSGVHECQPKENQSE